MDKLRLRIAREKWLGDAETAMRTPMRERDAFDAGYEAAERETLERVAQQLKEAIVKVRAKRGGGKFGKDENGWWDLSDELESAVNEVLRDLANS